MSICTAPPKSTHNYLHRGKRFSVFEVDAVHPFGGYEAHAEVLVFDKLYGDVVAFCDPNLNGRVSVGSFKESIPIYGANPRELVIAVSKALRAFEKHFAR